MKKLGKIFGWGALAIVLLFALVLALSPVAKYVVNNYGEQIIGRQLHADQVIINPYWGGVTIKGFECKEADSEMNFVSFDRLYVQIAWPRLIAKDVTIRHIHLDGFYGQVLKSGERVNFSDIIERYTKDSTEQEQPKDTTKGSWTVSLKDIRLNNSTVRYRDVISDKKWALEDLNLHVPGLYFDNTQTNAGIEFGLPTGGRVGIIAGMKMQASRYAVKLNLYDVHADVVLPLVQDYLDVSGLGAKLNGSLHVDGSLDNVQNILIKGNLGMTGLSLRDGDGDEIAALDELRVAIEKGDIAENTYLLDTLSIIGLTGNYEVHKNWNTLSRLMKGAEERKEAAFEAAAEAGEISAEEVEKAEQARVEAQNAPKQQKNTKPMVWLAKNVTLTGHDLTYEDYSMNNNWEYAIQTLTVNGRNVASNGRNSVNIKAQLTNNANLKLDYTGSLNLKRDDSRMNLKLTGVRLSDFSAICRNYTGYPLEDGVLAMESHMEVSGGKLKGDNTVIIDNPKAGKKERFSKAKYKNIPVRAGVNMLTSAQNKIVLDVPVAGDVTNPKFKLGKVIGRALLKVFFGPLMGVNDKDRTISDDELHEMQDLLGDDTVSEVSADVAMTAGDSARLPEVSK